MKALLTPAVVIMWALTAEGTTAKPTSTAETLAQSLNQKLRITPEVPHGRCTVLHFLSDTRLLASHDGTGPGIWDATTGRLERKLSFPGESRHPRLSYATPDGKWVVDRVWLPKEDSGWRTHFQVWDLSRDRQVAVSGPNLEGNAHHVYITQDKKTLWATTSANPLSGAFNQVRFKITGTDPPSIEIESGGGTGQEGVPHYHCATENLLIYFLETRSEDKGMSLCVWDLETLPRSSPRTLTLSGHSPKSFWRTYKTSVVRAGNPEPEYGYQKRVEVNGILEDRYTEPACQVYGCLAVPQRSELYVLVPYSKQPQGDTEGLRLTIIDTKEALREKLSFDLPLFKIQGMGLHPKRPILLCVTPDDRLLVIDTASRAIAKEVSLNEKVSCSEYVSINPAISPDGRLVAIANADGTIGILECSE